MMQPNKINVGDLCPSEAFSLMRYEFSRKSTFQRLFNEDSADLEIEEHAGQMVEEAKKHFKRLGQSIQDLQKIHEHLDKELTHYNFEDGVNKISHSFYDMDEDFYRVYHGFLKDIRKKYFDFDFFFQKIPTIRIHTPNSLNSHHYPRYHTDIAYGHPPQEINLWIPLTEPNPIDKHGFKVSDVQNSYSLLEDIDFDLQKLIDLAIHDPLLTEHCHRMAQDVVTRLGDMFAFDSRCIHTGMPLTHLSRVSIDVRIIPKDEFESLTLSYQGKGRMKTYFAPSEGYHAQSIEEMRGV